MQLKRLFITIMCMTVAISNCHAQGSFKQAVINLTENWSAIDSDYVEPCLYDVSVKALTNSTQDQMNLKSDNGTKMMVRAPFQTSAGIGVAWQWLGYDYTVNLNKQKLPDGAKADAYGISVFSQLMNINVQYRRAGGDYRLKKMELPFYGNILDPNNELAQEYTWGYDYNNYNMGSEVSVKMFSIDANYVWNHRKFSYPAMQTHGATQRRSAGSLITGLGFVHYSTTNTLADWQSEDIIFNILFNPENFKNLDYIVNSPEVREKLGNNLCTKLSFSDIEAKIGYAYNWVPMRNLMISGALTLAPSLKIYKGNNDKSLLVDLLRNDEAFKEIDDLYKDPPEELLDIFGDDYFKEPFLTPERQKWVDENVNTGKAYEALYHKENKTLFDVNTTLRVAVMWTNRRWFAGANFTLQHYRYHTGLHTKFDNAFGTLNICAGLRFLRSKDYRKGGKFANKYPTTTVF